MKKTLIFLALVSMVVLGTSVAIGQDSGLGDVDPSGVTVVYWHQYSEGSAQGDTIAALVEEFNATNEWGITVEASFQGNYTEIRDLMNGAIISGEMPNMVAGFQNDAASYALDGVVVDLNPYFDDADWGYSDDERATLNMGIIAMNVFEYEPFNGAMLAWPNQVSGTLLAVNTTMLGELGFDGPAETFEDFMAISCAAANSDLTGAEGVEVRGYPIKTDASNWETYLASYGGTMFDPVSNTYDFTSEASVNAFTLYADLWNSGCSYIPDTRFGNTDDFALGINPMALGSIAGAPFIAAGFEASGVEAEWVLTTTPWTEGNRAINLFSPGIIVLQGTAEQNLASWLFLQFISREEAQFLWSSNTGYLSMNTTASVNVYDAILEDNPILAGVINIFNDPEIHVYSSPNTASYGTVRGLISEAMADVTVNGMDVQEVVERLTDAANEAHAESQ